MMERFIKIAYYTDYPCGEDNAINFREEVIFPALEEAIKNNSTVVINLDGVKSYSAAWLLEVFGGLIKTHKLSTHQIEKHLTVEASAPGFERYKNAIKRYMGLIV